jgi:probable F420-dependent oxidoreductase
MAAIRFGLHGINYGPCADPEAAARVARAAEEAGFESVWTAEHVVLPDPRVPPSPMHPDQPILDPLTPLAYLAARTTRLRLATGIIILPQRNPLVLAKEAASVDVLSGGRLILGVAAGYLEPEFRALGAPFEGRGPRTVEYIAAMRAIWSEQRPASFSGRFVRFEGISARPLPVQRPGPPIVMGGHSPMALRRAVQHANGWYGWALDLDGATRCIEGLHAAMERYGRPAELGPLEISVTPRGEVTPETVERYAALGVHRLVLILPPRAGVDDLERFIAETARTLIGATG